MPWGLCLTECHQEHKAVRGLDRIGVATILAKYKDRHRNKCILFPRYLFVDIVQDWWKIPRTEYVKRLFTRGDEPCRIPDKYMTDLQARMRPDGTVELEHRERFSIGQRVEIIRGQFKSLLAIYDGITPRKQETALVDILGRKVRVEFHPGDLASV